MDQAEQAASILMDTIRMAVGTAQKTNDNGVQVTVVLPKKLWEKMEALAEIKDEPEAEGAAETSEPQQMTLL